MEVRPGGWETPDSNQPGKDRGGDSGVSAWMKPSGARQAAVASTILFVDDNVNIRRFCQLELEEMGYAVLTARDGAEALMLLRARPVDLVVTDLHMPRVGGMQAIGEIRRAYPQLPVIIHTAGPTMCLPSDGIAACVTKSGDPQPLTEAIAQALADRLGTPPSTLPPSTASADPPETGPA